MAYEYEKNTGDFVIDGFDKGIGDSPYTGFTDMRNVNITSVPNEASVNFATAKVSPPALSGNVTSASSSVYTFTGAGGLANQMGVIFSASTLTNVSINTLYLIGGLSGSTFKLYSDYGLSTQIVGSGTGTGTFTTLTPSQMKYFTKDFVGNYWGIDSRGYVWSNTITLSGGLWTPVGNLPNNDSNGNGLGFYQGTSAHGYIFIFSNSSIDYIQVTSPYTTIYQWDYINGSNGSWSASPSATLKTAAGTANSHETNIPPDGHFYFCDANWIGQFFQTDPAVPFDPTSLPTWTPSTTQLLPYNDICNCLSYLGTNLMVGGLLNAVYPWDRVSNQFNFPILLPENIVWKMVTVNTNTYMFVGNRGRIYLTNGTQAQLFKKVPDWLSGTVEPYFQFYGACYQKNQLYFSVAATTNGLTNLTTYGGVWGIDLDTGAMRLTNELSYGTYAGFASAMIATTQTAIAGVISSPNANGNGLFIGWSNGVGGFGIDMTTTAIYTGGQAYIISDMIPIGTAINATTPAQFEFKLSSPLLLGETVEMQIAAYVNGPFTSLGVTQGATPVSLATTILSDIKPNTGWEQQWILVKVILTGIASNPSYNRLTQIRIKHAAGK